MSPGGGGAGLEFEWKCTEKRQKAPPTERGTFSGAEIKAAIPPGAHILHLNSSPICMLFLHTHTELLATVPT